MILRYLSRSNILSFNLKFLNRNILLAGKCLFCFSRLRSVGVKWCWNTAPPCWKENDMGARGYQKGDWNCCINSQGQYCGCRPRQEIMWRRQDCLWQWVAGCGFHHSMGDIFWYQSWFVLFLEVAWSYLVCCSLVVFNLKKFKALSSRIIHPQRRQNFFRPTAAILPYEQLQQKEQRYFRLHFP